MSVLFPKVNKAPEWNWRPIYYDPKKDEMDEKLRRLQQKRAAEDTNEAKQEGSKTPDGYTPTLHRGSFRQAHEENLTMTQKARRQSKLAFWVVLLVMLFFVFYILL